MRLASHHRLLVGLVIGLAVTGCAGQPEGAPVVSESDASVPVEAIAAWNNVCTAADLSGEGYAVVGADPLNASLHRVELCPFRTEPVPDVQRVSGVGAGGGVVAIVTARDGVDKLELFDEGELKPVPGLGTVHAFSPSVSRNGVITYVFVDWDEGGSRLETHDPATHTTRVLHTTEGNLLLTARGPDGGVATVQAHTEDKADELIVVDAAGAVGKTPLPYAGGTATALTWGPGTLLALSSSSAHTTPGVLVEPGTGEVVGEIPGDWKVRTWLPDGERLLVKHRESALLGMVTREQPGVVRELAPFPAGPMWQLVLTDP